MTGEARIATLFAEAERAVRERRDADAVAKLRAILQSTPDDPRALNALANRVLAGGDAAAACALFERALAVDPRAAPVWLNYSLALRSAGREEEEIAALDRGLEIDPYFLLALMHKAQWLERHDRAEDAVRCYRSLGEAAPPDDQLPPAMLAAVRHGRELVARHAETIDQAIRLAIGDRPVLSQRFGHCLDVLAGRRRIYVQQPLGLHFPYLPAVQFFDRTLMPWFERLEAATDLIRDELRGLVASGAEDVPYVRVSPGQPVNQWEALNHSLDWGALFLRRDGAVVAQNAAHCPGTMALLDTLPLLDIPGRAPTVMFSTLRPGVVIPPHTGVTNTRAVVHLPLIVPDDCTFRVGSETRSWKVGEAWAFDDTIEHEARNDSQETRVILIVDTWNPFLDQEERELLRIVESVLQRPTKRL